MSEHDHENEARDDEAPNRELDDTQPRELDDDEGTASPNRRHGQDDDQGDDEGATDDDTPVEVGKVEGDVNVDRRQDERP